MANYFDQFDEEQASSGENFFDKFDEESPKKKSTIGDYLQDTARMFAPAITAPISGLQEVVRDAFDPGASAGVDSFVRGVQKDTFDVGNLSVDLAPETPEFQKISDYITKGLENIREFSGEGAVDLFKNPVKRQFLKSLPHTSLIGELYDKLNPEGKKNFESIVYAGGASAPEAIGLLLGAGTAKGKITPKSELPTETLDDILGGLRNEQKAGETGPIDYKAPELALEEPALDTTVIHRSPATGAEMPRYDNGIDFDYGIDLQKQGELDVTPTPTTPTSGLEFAPEGAYRTPPTVDSPMRDAPSDMTMEPQQGSLDFGTIPERDWTPTEEIVLGEDTPTQVANNASGESAASQEAINRLQSQNDAGIRIVEFDPDRGTITPLVTADRVDKRAAQGKAILQIDADGKVTMVENNSRYGNTPLTNRLDHEMKKQDKLGGTGKKGFGQGGAIDANGIWDGVGKLTDGLKVLLKDGRRGTVVSSTPIANKNLTEWTNFRNELGERAYNLSLQRAGGELKDATDLPAQYNSYIEIFSYLLEKNKTKLDNLYKKSEGVKFVPRVLIDGEDRPTSILSPKDIEKVFNGPLGSSGFGKGQRGSVGVYNKDKSLEQLAGELPKEEWINEFNKRRPNDSAFASQAYDRLAARQQVSKANKVDSKFVKAADVGLGLISTRLGNIHPVLERAAKASEQRRMQGIANGLSIADQFLTDINPKFRGGFNEADRTIINNMLLDNDLTSLEKKLAGVKGKSGKDLGVELKNTRRMIDNIGNELYQRKIINNLRQEYWPRVVKDYEGLANALGYETKTALDKYVAEVRTKYENRREPFDQQAMSDAVNGFLASRGERTTGAPYSKHRRMEKIPENLKQFYATPTESLHSYIRWANDKIAEHDFFGKSLRKDAEGKIDLGGSINDYIGEKLADGSIKPEQMEEVRKLLSARFRGGQNIAHGAIQTYKDINNLSLLTDFTTTASQAFDVVPSLWVNGITPTIQSAVMELARKNKEDVKQVAGIMDHFAEEFVGNRKSSEYVVKAFKGTGFSQLGRIAQNISTNAARIAREKEASVGKPGSRLYREYETYFGKDFPQLVDDLKNNRKTPLTDELLFSELSRVSPISKLEKTEWGLNHPNAGGLLYSLKSFVLKQADINRREVYNNIKKGDIKTATKAAAALTAYYAMSDIAYQDLKDYWANRPISDRTALQIALSNFRMMGLDKHFSDKLNNGEIASALTGLVAPPTRQYDVLGRDVKGVVNLGLDKMLGEDVMNPRPGPTGESLTMVPGVGDFLYGRTEKGEERRQRLEDRAMQEELNR